MAEAKQIRQARFCNRTDSLLNWTTHNPVLLDGELGIIQNGINEQTVLLVGDGETDVGTMLENYADYNNNIIFCGQGAQYDLPPAGIDLGGVKKGDETETGIKVDNGIVSNLLVDDYDMEEDCYIINKIHVRHLIADREEEVPVFESSTITLRYLDPEGVEEPEPLPDDDYAGITILRTKELEDGTLISTQVVVDNKEQLYVSRDEELRPVLTMENLSSVGKPSLIEVDKDTNLAKLTDVQSLTFTSPYLSQTTTDPDTGEEIIIEGSVLYDGLSPVTLDLTPASFMLNGQEMEYDPTQNAYSIWLDGGLNQENLDKLNSIDAVVEGFDALKTELQADFAELEEHVNETDASIAERIEQKLEINDVEVSGTGIITVSRDDGTAFFSVEHDTCTVERDTDQPEVIQKNEPYTFITGIEVDEYGHIKKIRTRQYKFI